MSFRDSFRFSFSPTSQNKGGAGSKSSSIRSRDLKFETLENRELLSVTSPVSDPAMATDNGAAVSETQISAPERETDVVVMEADNYILDPNLGVPDVTATVLSSETVSLNWGAVSKALYYDVWKITSTGDVHLGSVTGTSYTDANPNAGTNTYAVRAMTVNTFSDYKRDVTVTVSSSMNLQGTFNSDKTSIMLTWNGVGKADHYTVTWDFHDGTTSDTGSISLSSAYTYYDKSFPTKYETGYFTVYAYDADYNVLGYSALTVNRSDVNLTTPTITKYEQSGKDVELTWNAVSGAAKYIVSRIDSAGNEVSLNDNGTTDTHFTVKSASVGLNTYTVRAVSGTNVSDYQRDITVNVTFGVTAVTSAGSVNISWDAVSDATYYTVWYTDDFGSENWITVNNEKHLTDLSLTLALPSQESRTYGVRAFRSDGEYMGYGVASWFKTNLATPAVTASLESFGDGSACLLTWTAVANAKKYEVWDITGTHQSLAIVSGTSFLHLDAPFGETVYAVRALHDLAFSDYQRNVTCDRPLLSELTMNEGALVYSWEKVPGASYYDVWIDDGSGVWSLVQGGVTGTSLAITNPGLGNRTYWVHACDSAGTIMADGTSSYFYSAAGNLRVHQTVDRGFTISWTGGDEGSRVQVWRNDEIVATLTKSQLQKDADGRYYWVDNTLPEGGTGPYYYTIRALADASDDTVFFDSESYGPAILDAVSKPVVDAEQTAARKITLYWDDVPNATRYDILVGGVKVGEVPDEANILEYQYVYTVADAVTGPETFEFVVKAVNDNAEASSKTESLVWFDIPTDVKALLDTTDSSVLLTWTDNGNVDTVEYNIEVFKNGKIFRELYASNDEKTGCVIPVYLYGNGTYTFAIRAIDTIDGTYCEGPLSASSNAIVIATRPAPAPTAQQSGENVIVQWTVDGTASNYTISVNGTTSIVPATNIVGGTATYTIPRGASAPATFDIVVTAHYADSDTISSDPVSFTWFGTPGKPAVSRADATMAFVSWTDEVNDSDKVRYRVTAYLASNDSVVESIIVSDSTFTLFGNLTTGTAYYFKVRAIDATLGDILGPASVASDSIILT